MDSLPWSSTPKASTPRASKNPKCEYQDPRTGKICGKQYSKDFNLRRHIKKKHKGWVPGVPGDQRGQEDQDADYTDFDDSQSIASHDSFDDILEEAESLFETHETHETHGRAPIASMTAALPTSSFQTPLPTSSFETPLPTSSFETHKTHGGAPIASMTAALPTSSFQTPLPTLSPRTVSPVDTTLADGRLNNGSMAPRSVLGWSSSPRNFITSAPQMASPFLSPWEHTGQSMYQLTGDLIASMSRSPSPQDFSDQNVSIPQDMGHLMDPDNYRPNSPLLHDNSLMASPTPYNLNQMSPYPYDMSPTVSPVPQRLRTLHQMSPYPYDMSPTVSPVPQRLRTLRQPIRRLPAVVNATQLNATQPPSSPVPYANTPYSRSFLQDPGVVSDSDIDPDSASPSTSVTVAERKRKLSHRIASRQLQALNSETLPLYPAKRSKKVPDQQRGIDWLKTEARFKFGDFYRELLGRWGVAVGHTGTCVLVPEAYKALEPLEVMETITKDQERYARSGTPRAFFSMFDHGTTVVRALAWFSEWPRTGVQLDNFIGCGKFAPMDASHTCHHDHCIVHVTYETADKNTKREDCRREARALRQQNAVDVPEHCDKHDPPCLMQHTALSTFEVYCIQFAVLRQAKGMDAAPPVPRPRRWRYTTYETQLPCVFPSVRVRPESLVAEASSARPEGKPDITCKFCQRVRGWQSVAGFWTHLVKKHQDDVSDDARLAEVKRTGNLWRSYWEKYSSGGKSQNPTSARLIQMEDPDFSWQDVLEWDLRY